MTTPTPTEEAQDPRTFTRDQIVATVATGLGAFADQLDQMDPQHRAAWGLTPDLVTLLTHTIRTDTTAAQRLTDALFPDPTTEPAEEDYGNGNA